MSGDGFLTFNIIMNLIALSAYVFLSGRQFLEIRRLPGAITQGRYLIFAVYILAVVVLVPVLMQQALRLQGAESVFLTNINLVLSPISRVAIAFLLIKFTLMRITLREEK